ncbi:MAG: DUF3800 domain-containing protein [Treponema sp.]|nr:DUF3800 domain-containing protein [Treponema sp.]
MVYNIYLDESGNTGNIELRDGDIWNYGNQPYFALGSFYIEESIANEIEQQIIEILHSYNSKLGTETELKSKANYIFKEEMLEKITALLCNKKAGFYFDIANKKYKAIINIVEYCVYPWFVDSAYIFARNEKNEAANFLYKTLSEDDIKTYINLCQTPCNDDEKITCLLSFLVKLENHYIVNKCKNNPVKAVIEVVNNYKKYNFTSEQLFPIEDFNNKGTKESFLPNVDAYNNIISSIANLKLGKNDVLNIYHDEQKQFSGVLEVWTRYMKSLDLGIGELKFCVSKDNVLVQIADFYTGNIVRLYRKIVEYKPLNRADRELIKILKPLLGYCNIVAPKYQQMEFFNQCGLKTMNTPIPFKF